MSSNPFFSVIIPVFNGSKTIEKTLGCLAMQSFCDFETIVIDDGSVDDTAAIVTRNNLEQLIYVYQENRGVCAARNHGALLAKGNYLIFLDSDDQVTPDWLQDFFKEIISSGVSICFCGSSFDFERETVLGKENFLAGAFCIKKDLFLEAGGYDDNLKFSENTELGWRVMDLDPVVAFVRKVNFRYTRRGKTGLSYLHNRIAAFYILARKHALRFENNPRLGRTYYQVAAVDSIRLGNFKEGRRLMWLGFRYTPTSIKAFGRALCTSNAAVMKTLWKPVNR